MVCPKFETKFLRKLWNSNVFSVQKRVVSKKKRSLPKLSLIFRPKSEIQTIFLLKNRWSPKNKKQKSSSPKLSLIFRPKLEIQTLFHTESRHLLHNFGTQFSLGGAVFIFSPKIGLKSNKNVRFCILHKPMGGLELPPPPPPPPWLRYCLLSIPMAHSFVSGMLEKWRGNILSVNSNLSVAVQDRARLALVLWMVEIR